jgi:hypothetical protein
MVKSVIEEYFKHINEYEFHNLKVDIKNGHVLITVTALNNSDVFPYLDYDNNGKKIYMDILMDRMGKMFPYKFDFLINLVKNDNILKYTTIRQNYGGY